MIKEIFIVHIIKSKDYKNLINFKFNNMKKFKDLKVGDTVYKVIFYTPNSNILLKIRKEKVTAIEEVHSGAIIKTEHMVILLTYIGIMPNVLKTTIPKFGGTNLPFRNLLIILPPNINVELLKC